MQIITIGEQIFLDASSLTIHYSETFRADSQRASWVVLETCVINKKGTSPAITITLQQSTDGQTWDSTNLPTNAHSGSISAPDYIRGASTSAALLQPVLRLKYATSGTTPMFVFSARLTITAD